MSGPIRHADGSLRPGLVLAACCALGICSALFSAWAPVAYWAWKSPAVYDRRIYLGEPTLQAIREFPDPTLPRAGSVRYLTRRNDTPTRGLRWEWLEGAVNPEGGDRYLAACSAMQAGWPWPTMQGACADVAVDQLNNPGASNYQRVTAGALMLPATWIARPSGFFQGGFGPQDWFLPTRPTWGFALHAALVGALTSSLLLGLDYTRRRRRVLRGLCPRCRYPVAGLNADIVHCPECGGRVPAPSPANVQAAED